MVLERLLLADRMEGEGTYYAMLSSQVFQWLHSAAPPGRRLSRPAASLLLFLLASPENVSDLHERPQSQTFEAFSLPVGSQDGLAHEESVFVISQMFHLNDAPEKLLKFS